MWEGIHLVTAKALKNVNLWGCPLTWTFDSRTSDIMTPLNPQRNSGAEENDELLLLRSWSTSIGCSSSLAQRPTYQPGEVFKGRCEVKKNHIFGLTVLTYPHPRSDLQRPQLWQNSMEKQRQRTNRFAHHSNLSRLVKPLTYTVSYLILISAYSNSESISSSILLNHMSVMNFIEGTRIRFCLL